MSVTHEQIIAYLHNLTVAGLNFSAAKLHLDDLPKGVWNFNYLLHCNEQKFVVKVYQVWPRSASMFTANSGRREYQVLRLLAPLQLAPTPHWFDADGGLAGHQVLIYDYIEGETLSVNGYSDALMPAMAEIYARLHQFSPEAVDFLSTHTESAAALLALLTRKFAHYRRRDDISAHYKNKFGRYLNYCADWVGDNDDPATPITIIHADPVGGNIILGKKPVLIDWQTVMLGDPVFDVWAFTAAPFALWDMAQTPTPAQAVDFRQSYQRYRHDPTLNARLKLKTPLYLLEYGLHLSTRYHDYKAGLLPTVATMGREANFEKYGPNADIALDSLAKLLG